MSSNLIQEEGKLIELDPAINSDAQAAEKAETKARLKRIESFNPATSKHWLWGNWISLSIAAMLSFSVCNIFIGSLSSMGIKSIYYFNSGSLIFALGYFIVQREWSKRNNGPRPAMLDQDRRKVLTRTWVTNKFDWWSMFLVLVGACFQTAIFTIIAYSFKISNMADLNIGISSAIWAINPFMVAILEWACYKQTFDFTQIWGMSLLVLCAIIVSLSEIFIPGESVIVTTVPAG